MNQAASSRAEPGGNSRERAARQAVVMAFADTLITFGAMAAAHSAVILADFCKTFL